ncbi:TRAP transporter large permease [Virgibacillus sp. NKC19-3]|uniref:TRAP transporter large permease n=1 Tax=Virgibacillus saliphilus TaxID=2831674 RepID=UPI001C9B28A2|nr:TRAP transporter large permease [Virgibacillus sp. NKC19-3]MBY7142566.1 TRAP transporter large permease [Virgibacillus sp. NKC19-3]
MGSLTLGVIIAIASLAIILAGMPIAFALGFVTLVSMILFVGPTQYEMFAEYTYDALHDFALLAIPLFIFMGAIFARSKASTSLFDAAYKWLGKLPGGLAISSVIASAIFSAISGSSPATAAAIGKAAIPEMKKRNYSNTIATGAVVAGGTLGILVPPSVVLILYGIAVEVSIGKLFIAGIIPGLLLTTLFSVWIYIATKLENRGIQVSSAEGAEYVKNFSWTERFRSLFQIIPFILLLVAILGALYAGIATPSEGAAIGAILALLMVIVIYRSMNWKKLIDILLTSTRESTMVLMIVVFSALLGTLMSFLSIPQDLANLIIGLDISKWIVLVFINLFLLMLGLFIPPAAIILMTAPILLPIITGLGFDPIWFGIVMTINMEAGLITPPVGLNLFVVKGIVPDIPTGDIIKGSLPYVFLLLIAIALFTIFPGVVTWLPDLLM